MIEIRLMEKGEEQEVIHLVKDVFDRQVAPTYKPEGREAFFRYANVDALKARMANHKVFVAEFEDELVGILEMRGTDHVSMFFVSDIWQKRGVGTALFDAAMKSNLSENPELEKITVNSSPNSVKFYKSLGFETQKPEQESDGIRFTPMILDLWH